MLAFNTFVNLILALFFLVDFFLKHCEETPVLFLFFLPLAKYFYKVFFCKHHFHLTDAIFGKFVYF